MDSNKILFYIKNDINYFFLNYQKHYIFYFIISRRFFFFLNDTLESFSRSLHSH